MNTRFLIAAGGTGGHFYPGFALGSSLNQQDCSVLFVVRKNDPASQILQERKLKYREVDICALPRSINPWKYIVFVWKLVRAYRAMRQLVKEFMPDVAVGTGGYVSFPLIAAAHSCGVKTVIHDSNTKIGLSNRVCARFADQVLLGLPVTPAPARSVLVGTPLRPEFAEQADRCKVLQDLGLDPSYKTVLIFGGSQGARDLNHAMVASVKETVQQLPAVQFIHISGERWYQTIKNQYEHTPRVQIMPYCNEIYDLMQSADLVISRSGAGTISELFYCRKPALLVPLPTAADNHQFYNARILEQSGCAVIIQQGPDLVVQLQTQLKKLLENEGGALLAMSEKYNSLDLPNPLTASQCIENIVRRL